MKNDVQIYTFQDKPVRAVIVNGEMWFVLRDLCDVLELGSPHKVAERLDEDERSQIPVTDSLGRQQETAVVNESGMYTVILRSDKPLARPFRRWVTGEVLPSIRKTGAYVAPEAEQSVGEIYLRTGRVLYSQKCKVCTSPHAGEINRRLTAGDTYDSILAWAAEQGLNISKAGLSRHNSAHRVPDFAEKSLLENPEIASRLLLAKLTEIAQKRTLDGLSDRELVKYIVALSGVLNRDGGSSKGNLPAPVEA